MLRPLSASMKARRVLVEVIALEYAAALAEGIAYPNIQLDMTLLQPISVAEVEQAGYEAMQQLKEAAA